VLLWLPLVLKSPNMADVLFLPTCGSADVLEALGVNVNQTPQQVASSVNAIGIGFMFAPNHHSAMKYDCQFAESLGENLI
jgi:anthranilate phosphoribosyltransferase